MNDILYEVLFKNSTKPYKFCSEENFDLNSYVIVETENGPQYGKVVGTTINDHKYEYKQIIRIADQSDENQYFNNLKDSDIALNKTKKMVKDLNLDMHLVNASYNFDRSQLLVNFYADDRVDFRELAKKMAFTFKTRIELRQIGARDKAKQVGGIGVCGNELCCTSFLNQIDSISMNRAKNQNLALNPSKINGNCGRLLCCLVYEDDEYSRCRKGLLPIGTEIFYKDQKAKIISVDILKRSYRLLINEQYYDVKADDIDGSKK